jgi:hypothetical protein
MASQSLGQYAALLFVVKGKVLTTEERGQKIDFDVLGLQRTVSRIKLCISSPGVVAIV